MTRAVTPSGQDAFEAIASRLAAVVRPVDSVLKIAGQLPAEREFRLFATALALAEEAYQVYLNADLRLTQGKEALAADVLADMNATRQ